MTVRLWHAIVGFVVVILAIFVLVNWGFFATRVSYWISHDVFNRPARLTQDISGQPDRLAIPSLGLEAPLVYVDATDELTLQIGLTKGVVHYPGTAQPGEYGNAFYFGHSSDFPTKPGNYKTIFALLPEIKLGDIIDITNQSGRLFRYQVIDKQIVSSSQTEFLSQSDQSDKILTLQTSYPVGTALKRYIVQAKEI